MKGSLNRKITFISLAVLFSIFVPYETIGGRNSSIYSVEAATVLYETTANVSMRAGASNHYKVITTIPKGKRVLCVAKYGSWSKVKYENKTGFVSSEYLKSLNTPVYIKGVLIANKNYGLPANYAPGESKEARYAFNKMATDAKKDGVRLYTFSTYRSFATQSQLYNQYVARDGRAAADRYSARPGYSEHQTGLAFDIAEVGASDPFKESKATQWMARNAYKYGFIVRYPQGKERITGYMYEPWHLRYLGVNTATKVYKSGLTLEEYLGIY